MAPAFPLSRDLLATTETLLIAAAGGVLFTLIGFPAGLVAGSMLAVAVAALIGRPMKVPLGLARGCFALVGVLLGAVVTPETLAGLAAWPGSIAILAVSTIIMFAATTWYLRVVHGWDALSALLGASPGSMGQVLVLAAELGGDLRGVAIVHTMRVLLIVLGLPAGLALFGLTVGPLAPRSDAAASPGELAILLAVSGALAYLLQRIRFPDRLDLGRGGGATAAAVDAAQTLEATWRGKTATMRAGALAAPRLAAS